MPSEIILPSLDLDIGFVFGGGVWGVSEAALHGARRADSIEGVVIAAAVGLGIGLVGGMKKAYDDFQMETLSCS